MWPGQCCVEGTWRAWEVGVETGDWTQFGDCWTQHTNRDSAGHTALSQSLIINFPRSL